MEEAVARRSGPIEGTSRVLRELLRTPRFKASVRIILNDLDPENAALLVRTIAWEDPEFFLGLMGAAPDIMNVGIIALDELVKQVAKMPPALLAPFAASALARLDAESLGEAVGGMIAATRAIGAAPGDGLGEALSGFVSGFAKGLASAGVGDPAALAREAAAGIRRFASEHPDAMKEIVVPVVAAWREALASAETEGE